MPRTGRGGTRAGTPGAAYPNRTDLQGQSSLPARVATGQTYGKAQAQLQAQRTVPMAAPPQPGVPPVTAPPVGGGGMPSPGMQGGSIAPGAFGPLDRPTERPGEPVTTGIAMGRGAGPEAMGPPPASDMVSSILQRAAAATSSATLNAMAQRASAAGM